MEITPGRVATQFTSTRAGVRPISPAPSTRVSSVFQSPLRAISGHRQVLEVAEPPFTGEPLGGAGVLPGEEAGRQRRVLAVGNLLRRAQEAGAVRGDVDTGEVIALLTGVFAAIAHRERPALPTGCST